jgi:hypothetical protein
MHSNSTSNWCGSKDHGSFNFNRRNFLSVGFLGSIGLSLNEALALQSQSELKAKAKSVINIFLPGGMAHQESWDPKIHAPIEYRGPLGSVPTVIPGVHFSENLTLTAKIADKITVVRSMTHGEAAHERGTHNMMTGYKPSPALSYPSFGSVVSHELGMRNNIPPYVCIPNQPSEFAGSGYLSKMYSGFSINSDPANAGYKVQDLSFPSGVDNNRFNTRRSMLDAVNDHFRIAEDDKLKAVDSFYEKAYSLIGSDSAKGAFDIEKETAATRDMYGRNAAGQRMLLARRLVEAGTRFVTVTYGGWDMHDNIANGMKNQLPNFDRAYSALINDLNDRGMLDETLVIVTSEFGRTPKINGTAGRDHWPSVYSIALAGGGIKRGYIHGASDAQGAQPDSEPLTVENLSATIYTLLGIDPEKRLMTSDARPVSIVYNGQVEKDLLS